MPDYDAIVLGTGGIGSAALYQLARRGARVLGLDRFPPGHDRGSSHGETRIIRQAYFEHADYVPLLLEAYRLWDELERRCGERLFYPIGLLEVGPADGVVVPGVRRAAEKLENALASINHWCRYVVRRQFDDSRGWELQNMLTVARLMVAAALSREESRGVHFRTDFPFTDNEHWLRHSSTQFTDSQT